MGARLCVCVYEGRERGREGRGSISIAGTHTHTPPLYDRLHAISLCLPALLACCSLTSRLCSSVGVSDTHTHTHVPTYPRTHTVAPPPPRQYTRKRPQQDDAYNPGGNGTVQQSTLAHHQHTTIHAGPRDTSADSDT